MMNEIAFINIKDKQGHRASSMHHNAAIYLDKLSDIIIASGNSIYTALKSGLPKAVYQLKLHNELKRKGLKLHTEMSMLTNCVKDEPAREIMIIDDVIVIECICDNTVTEHLKKRVMFDLENNSHARGILINFSDDMQNDMFTIVNNNAVFH